MDRDLDEIQGVREPLLSGSFIRGLRAGLEAGLTCEQVAAVVAVADGLRSVSGEFDEGELVARAGGVLESIENDIRRE